MLATLLLLAALSEDSDRVQTTDLQRLEGKTWKGTLAYLDYTSNKTVTIPSTLAVERARSGPSSWVWYYGYTDEPDHNSGSLVTLDYEGRRFDGKVVVERKSLPNRVVVFVTETKGADNDRPATLRHVYRIGNDTLSVQKLVKYDGTASFFERHVYSWKR